jgi:hypothetical protein
LLEFVNVDGAICKIKKSKNTNSKHEKQGCPVVRSKKIEMPNLAIETGGSHNSITFI